MNGGRSARGQADWFCGPCPPLEVAPAPRSIARPPHARRPLRVIPPGHPLRLTRTRPPARPRGPGTCTRAGHRGHEPADRHPCPPSPSSLRPVRALPPAVPACLPSPLPDAPATPTSGTAFTSTATKDTRPCRRQGLSARPLDTRPTDRARDEPRSGGNRSAVRVARRKRATQASTPRPCREAAPADGPPRAPDWATPPALPNAGHARLLRRSAQRPWSRRTRSGGAS